MIINFEVYLKEKQEYLTKLSTLEEKEQKELTKKYKSGLRKYLNLALTTIQNTLGIEYSIYKKDKVMSAASYKVIETMVQKKYDDVVLEIENLKNIENTKELSIESKNNLNYSYEILIEYIGVEI